MRSVVKWLFRLKPALKKYEGNNFKKQKVFQFSTSDIQ